MASAFVVTAGEYSDYHIEAVFANRSDAEVFCAMGHGENIEEYEVQTDTAVHPVPRIMYRFHVTRPNWPDGGISEPLYILESCVDEDKAIIESWKEHYLDRKWNVIDCDSHIDRYVYLYDNVPAKALKIVRDRIAKAKAERKGI